MEDFITLNIINFADMAKSFITKKLIGHNYLVSSLSNCTHETLPETSLTVVYIKILNR